jgi:hypothetical protein
VAGLSGRPDRPAAFSIFPQPLSLAVVGATCVAWGCQPAHGRLQTERALAGNQPGPCFLQVNGEDQRGVPVLDWVTLVTTSTATTATTVAAPAATAAATTSSATPATATTAATAAVLAGLGLVDREGSTTKGGAIQRGDGLVCAVGHFDETEAARLAGIPIRDDLGAGHAAKATEGLAEVVRRGVEGKVANVNVLAHAGPLRAPGPVLRKRYRDPIGAAEVRGTKPRHATVLSVGVTGGVPVQSEYYNGWPPGEADKLAFFRDWFWP